MSKELGLLAKRPNYLVIRSVNQLHLTSYIPTFQHLTSLGTTDSFTPSKEGSLLAKPITTPPQTPARRAARNSIRLRESR